MDIKTAIDIIEAKREMYDLSFFDMVVEMNDQLEADELSSREAAAVRVFMREGRRLFAPA